VLGVVLIFETGECSSASGSNSPTVVDVGNRRGCDGVRLCSGFSMLKVIAQLLSDVADIIALPIGVGVRVPHPLVDFVVGTSNHHVSGQENTDAVRGV
jgi:hypothetical protein